VPDLYCIASALTSFPDRYYIATIATFVGVVVLAVMAVSAMRRHEGRHLRSSDALWDDLRRGHGLSRGETRHLRTIAERANRPLVFSAAGLKALAYWPIRDMKRFRFSTGICRRRAMFVAMVMCFCSSSNRLRMTWTWGPEPLGAESIGSLPTTR